MPVKRIRTSNEAPACAGLVLRKRAVVVEGVARGDVHGRPGDVLGARAGDRSPAPAHVDPGGSPRPLLARRRASSVRSAAQPPQGCLRPRATSAAATSLVRSAKPHRSITCRANAFCRPRPGRARGAAERLLAGRGGAGLGAADVRTRTEGVPVRPRRRRPRSCSRRAGGPARGRRPGGVGRGEAWQRLQRRTGRPVQRPLGTG